MREQTVLLKKIRLMPVVTVTVFRYKPLARFRAFGNMGRALMQPHRAEGLQFSKLMGSGINFGIIPDFATYVHLGVWENDDTAQALGQSSLFDQLRQGTEQTGTLFLNPQRTHGLWDGQNPFAGNEATSAPAITTGPVAVLTRATIRARALPDFWQHVPQARQRLADHADDLLFGIGVGEVPLVQQCTISVWRSPAAIDRYAYRQSGHKEVVRMTRERKWYAEELFARFSVSRVKGALFAGVEKAVNDGGVYLTSS